MTKIKSIQIRLRNDKPIEREIMDHIDKYGARNGEAKLLLIAGYLSLRGNNKSACDVVLSENINYRINEMSSNKDPVSKLKQVNESFDGVEHEIEYVATDTIEPIDETPSGNKPFGALVKKRF